MLDIHYGRSLRITGFATERSGRYHGVWSTNKLSISGGPSSVAQTVRTSDLSFQEAGHVLVGVILIS